MKAITLLLTLMITFSVSAIEDCRSSDHYSVVGQYMQYNYVFENDTPRVQSKELKVSPLHEIWSEMVAEFHEVYLIAKNGADQADRVVITYSYSDEKLYTKNFSLESAELPNMEGKIRKVLSFKFSDGAKKNEYRPGIQIFSFFNGDKPLCKIEVKHVFAEPDS